MSLGGGASSAMDLALQNSIAAGITSGVAAGNSNADARATSPARVPEAITVAASTIADGRAPFSNFGTCLDVFAPGVNVTSAYFNSDTDSATMSGTSMASPHVAGVAALYLQSNPTALPAAVASAITGGATQNVIASAGTGSPNRLLFAGVSTVAVAPPPPPTSTPPVANFTSSCVSYTCSLDGSSSTGTGLQYSWDLGKTPGRYTTGATVGVTYSNDALQRTVVLTVTDNAGRTASITKVMDVNATAPPPASNAPVANFTWSCASYTCSLDGSSSTGTGLQYSWDLGKTPARCATGVTVGVTYPNDALQRTVVLTVTDNTGRTAVLPRSFRCSS